jgi:hypothetical protein
VIAVSVEEIQSADTLPRVTPQLRRQRIVDRVGAGKSAYDDLIEVRHGGTSQAALLGPHLYLDATRNKHTSQLRHDGLHASGVGGDAGSDEGKSHDESNDSRGARQRYR